MVSIEGLRTHMEYYTLDCIRRACQAETEPRDPVTVRKYKDALREEMMHTLGQLEVDSMQGNFGPEKAELDALLRRALRIIETTSERIIGHVLRQLFVEAQLLSILSPENIPEGPPNRIKKYLS